MAVAHISKDEFEQKVLKSSTPVFVDFYAQWCGPCKMTSPIIEELAEAFKNIAFYKIDVDANSDLAGEYSVFSIPTFVIFKDGKVIHQFSGAMGKEAFEAEIRKATG